jgi:hypothetical protein
MLALELLALKNQQCFTIPSGEDHFSLLSALVLSSFTDHDEAQSLLCITEAIFVMILSFLLSPFEHRSSIM